MTYCRRLILPGILMLSAIVTSCQTPKPPAPAPLVTSSEQKMCVARCNEENAHCNHKYGMIYRQCVTAAHQQATLNYKAYFDSQIARKKKPKDMKKTFNDFLNTQDCQQQLDCKRDQVACYKECDL